MAQTALIRSIEPYLKKGEKKGEPGTAHEATILSIAPPIPEMLKAFRECSAQVVAAIKADANAEEAGSRILEDMRRQIIGIAKVNGQITAMIVRKFGPR